jgi:hypothetical protein
MLKRESLALEHEQRSLSITRAQTMLIDLAMGIAQVKA